MGNTTMQHRMTTGCFGSRLCSSDWSPSSSGKAHCNTTLGSKICPPSQNLLGVFLLIMKLAIISTPIILLMADMQGQIANIKFVASLKVLSGADDNDKQIKLWRMNDNKVGVQVSALDSK